MKTAAALRKEEADEEKRRQRKTQNDEKKHETHLRSKSSIFSPATAAATPPASPPSFGASSVSNASKSTSDFFFFFQVKLFVGHDSFIRCADFLSTMYPKRGEREKRSRLSEKRRTRRGKSEISSVNVLSIIPETFFITTDICQFASVGFYCLCLCRRRSRVVFVVVFVVVKNDGRTRSLIVTARRIGASCFEGDDETGPSTSVLHS